MRSKYHIGDKIRVITNVGQHLDYPCAWVDSMNKYRGRIFTIISVVPKSMQPGKSDLWYRRLSEDPYAYTLSDEYKYIPYQWHSSMFTNNLDIF